MPEISLVLRITGKKWINAEIASIAVFARRSTEFDYKKFKENIQ